MKEPAENRLETIKKIWRDENNRWLYALIGFVTGCLFIPFITTESEFLASLFPEAAGILFTVLIIDTIYRNRAEAQEIKRLVKQLNNDVNIIALQALEELAERVSNGCLSDKFFMRANLEDATIRNANFNNSRFYNVNLVSTKISYSSFISTRFELTPLNNATISNTTFEQSNLSGLQIQSSWLSNVNFKSCRLINSNFSETQFYNVDLEDTNLQSAKFDNTKFTQCTLRYLNFSFKHLQNVEFIGCDLRGANFENARTFGTNFLQSDLSSSNLRNIDLGVSILRDTNMTNADLTHTTLPAYSKTFVSDYTILPDGSKWTGSSDTTRFTDPNHKQYWQPSKQE